MTEAQAFYAALGRRIQDLRRARHLTQEELGSRMTPPVTRASIANVERGKQGVLAFTLVQIARELRAAPSDLLPSESMAATAPQEQKQVENELALKLSVPPAASKRLTEKLLAEPASARRKHERSSRTTSR